MLGWLIPPLLLFLMSITDDFLFNSMIIKQYVSFFFPFLTCILYLLVVCVAEINPLNAELNPTCYLLALLAHHFL
jgi:hypothetical protein